MKNVKAILLSIIFYYNFRILVYFLNFRCTSYNNLGAGCVMVSDPNDACCVVPQCTYVPTSGPAQPGSTPPTVCPYPMPTAVPGVITGGPQPDPVTGVQPSNVGELIFALLSGDKWS